MLRMAEGSGEICVLHGSQQMTPALMHIFGDANWWLPAWLDRITPNVHVDTPDAELSAPDGKEPASMGARSSE